MIWFDLAGRPVPPDMPPIASAEYPPLRHCRIRKWTASNRKRRHDPKRSNRLRELRSLPGGLPLGAHLHLSARCPGGRTLVCSNLPRKDDVNPAASEIRVESFCVGLVLQASRIAND